MFPVVVISVMENVCEMFLQGQLSFVQFPIREVVGCGKLLQLILHAGDFGRPVKQAKVKLVGHAQGAADRDGTIIQRRPFYFSTNSGNPVISSVAATSAEGRLTRKVRPLPFIWR